METKFALELAALLDKFDAKLIAETGYGDFEPSSVAVVFPEFTETLGNWVSSKSLKEKVQNQ